MPSQSNASPTIDLSANENPLGPSPNALAAIEHCLKNLHRYPSKDGDALRDRLAQQQGVCRHNLLLGNGATELLEFAARAVLAPNTEAVVATPCFMPYQKVVKRAGARLVRVLCLPGQDPLEAMLPAISQHTRLVILGNPNNPTGTILTQSQLDRFIERLPQQVLLVLDEAYAEYVDDPEFPDALAYVRAGRNILVLRSLSKAYGLAGLRIGYGVAPQSVIEGLDAERQHYNTNALAQAAALAAVEDEPHLYRTLANNAEGRVFLARSFDALGLDHLPSQANFIMVAVGDGERVTRELGARNIRVKPMARFGLPAHIRVSIGLPRENWALTQALTAILASTSGHQNAPIPLASNG